MKKVIVIMIGLVMLLAIPKFGFCVGSDIQKQLEANGLALDGRNCADRAANIGEKMLCYEKAQTELFRFIAFQNQEIIALLKERNQNR